MPRKLLLFLVIVASLAVGAAMPGLLARFNGPGAPAPGAQQEAAGRSAAEGLIPLSAAQIEAAKITVAKAGPGVIRRQLTVPATLKPDPDHLARVAGSVVPPLCLRGVTFLALSAPRRR